MNRYCTRVARDGQVARECTRVARESHASARESHASARESHASARESHASARDKLNEEWGWGRLPRQSSRQRQMRLLS